MLEIVPKGVMHFPGNSINDNLADKGQEARYPSLQIRRRVSTACSSFSGPPLRPIR